VNKLRRYNKKIIHICYLDTVDIRVKTGHMVKVISIMWLFKRFI